MAWPTFIGTFVHTTWIRSIHRQQGSTQSSYSACLQHPRKPAISARNVNFTWSNGRCALADVNFDVYPGQLTMLVGRNGCGKSTLLKVLRTMIFPDIGTLHVDSPCAYIMQDADRQILLPSIGSDVSMSVLDRETKSREDIKKEVDDMLEYVGLIPANEFRRRGRMDLSGGQKQRAVLAAALLQNPRTILFDEVTASLDPISRYDLLDRVKKLVSEKNIAAIWYVLLLTKRRSLRILRRPPRDFPSLDVGTPPVVGSK